MVNLILPSLQVPTMDNIYLFVQNILAIAVIEKHCQVFHFRNGFDSVTTHITKTNIHFEILLYGNVPELPQ